MKRNQRRHSKKKFSGSINDSFINLKSSNTIDDSFSEAFDDQVDHPIRVTITRADATSLKSSALEEQGIISENQTLRVLLEDKKFEITRLKTEQRETDVKIQEQMQNLAITHSELEEKKREVRKLEGAIVKLESAYKKTNENLSKTKKAKGLTEDRLAKEVEKNSKLVDKFNLVKTMACISIALFVCVIVELLIHFVFKWNHLLLNKNSMVWQVVICFIMFSSIVGVWLKSWRTNIWLLMVGLLCFVLTLLVGI